MPRPGRPARITDQLTKPDGTTVPLVDQLLADIRLHGFTEEAAARAGIHRTSVYDWLKVGAQVQAKLTKNPGYRPTANERRCLEFSYAVDRARAEALTEGTALMLRLARGAREGRTVTTTKRTMVPVPGPDGSVVMAEQVETTTRVEDVLPEVRALIWSLEHRFPELVLANRIELTGADGGAIELEVDSPGERLGRLLDTMLVREAESAQLLAEASGPAEQLAIEAGE